MPGGGSTAALGAAIDFIDGLGIDRIAAHGRALTRLLITRLREIPRLTLLPGVAWADRADGYGIVSFRLEGPAPTTSGSR